MEDPTAAHKVVYDQLASEYEANISLHEPLTELCIDRFIPYVISGNRILDVGCATGLAMSIFARKGFQPTGVELSPVMAALARARVPDSTVICGDVLTAEIPGPYDAIFAQAFIHLFPYSRAIKVLCKVRELLHPLAPLYISTTESTVSTEGWYEKADYQQKLRRYRKFWTKDEFRRAVLTHGFDIIDAWDVVDPLGKPWMILCGRRTATPTEIW